MYEKIDVLIIGLISVGTLYGLLKGPFALLLPMAGITAGHSIISRLKPQILSIFTDEGTRAIVSLLYYPLCYFIILGLLSYAGRRIDRHISKIIPFGRYLLGGLLGFSLTTFTILTVLTLSLKLIKNQAPQDYRKSRIICMTDNFLQENPAIQKRIYNFLPYDKIEKQISNIKTKSDITEKSLEESSLMASPKTEDKLGTKDRLGAENKLENHAAELADILQKLESIAAEYKATTNGLISEENLIDYNRDQ